MEEARGWITYLEDVEEQRQVQAGPDGGLDSRGTKEIRENLVLPILAQS